MRWGAIRPMKTKNIEAAVLQDKSTELWPTTAEETSPIQLWGSHYETRINSILQEPMHSQLVHFLKRNQDVFTWSPEDMSSIDYKVIWNYLNVDPISHLNVNPISPPIEKKRIIELEKKAAKEEIDKLL